MLPILFDSSFFTLYSYPLFMGLAWGIAYFLTQILFEKYKVDSSALFKLYTGIFIFSWIGAKFFFLLFSSQKNFYNYIYADYFWLGGGFVFYGGLIFGIIFYLIYSLKFKKFDFQKSFLLIPGLAFGHATGRIGCLLTGCCFGTLCRLPWAIRTSTEFRHPVQFYEAISLFTIGILALDWIKKKKTNKNIILNYILIYSVVRFCIEFFRGDEVRGVYWSLLSSSQLISLGLFIFTVFMKYKTKLINDSL